MEATLKDVPIPEIWETEEDKKLSIDGLRRFYKEFALKNFRHNPYTNKNIGWKMQSFLKQYQTKRTPPE